ncbi:MAG: ribonuclease D [Alphaproteobacteria bacterium]|nr:ribonuclease D [Alphaproteobacteria bacterium]
MGQIYFYENDLPDNVKFENSVAVDTETMGLEIKRDRLCLVQLSSGDGNCHIVRLKKGMYNAPNLKALFEDKSVLKIFQYARFDVAAIYYYLGAVCAPVYCTKIASKIARTNAPSHSLKSLCEQLLNVELIKEQQCSDWGAETLTQEQLTYAANDVLYLHQLKEKLDALLEREGRTEYAKHCFDFLPYVGKMEVAGFNPEFVFTH